MKKMMIVIGLLFFSCFLIAPIATPQEQKKKVIIGLIPEMNIFKQKQRFKILGDYLSKQTGIEIQFTVLSRYGNILDRFKTDRLDGAFFGSFTGALGLMRLDVEPIARPVNIDNTSQYQGYIFVKKNSGIKTAADMKGKRIAYVDRATTAGYLFPIAYLKENGITDINGFFKEQYFAGSHDAAITAVLENKADIGAAKHSMYDRLSKENPRVDLDLVIIAKSPWVPSNGLLVRKSLDASIKKKLKEALLKLDTTADGKTVLQKFGALRFIATTAEDYKPVFELAKRAGFDLKTYDCSNE